MLFIIASLVILIIFWYECYKSEEVEIYFDIKKFNSPYYVIGVSMLRHETEEGEFDEEFVLGLFFFSLIIIFRKTM